MTLKSEYGELELDEYDVEAQADDGTVPKEHEILKTKSVDKVVVSESLGRSIDGKDPITK